MDRATELSLQFSKKTLSEYAANLETRCELVEAVIKANNEIQQQQKQVSRMPEDFSHDDLWDY